MDLKDFNELFKFYYLSIYDSVASILVMDDLPDSLKNYYSPPIFRKEKSGLTIACTFLIKLNLRSQTNLMRDSLIVTHKEIKLYNKNTLGKSILIY
jgi:hypothetical protein